MKMYDEVIGIHNAHDIQKMRSMARSGDKRMDDLEAQIAHMEEMMKKMTPHMMEDENSED